MSLIWQISTDNGTTWTNMPTPSTHEIDWEDLDNDSYRSVATGNLNRSIIARRWAKVGLSWKLLQESDVESICSSVNQDNVKFKFLSPAFGTNNYIEFYGYVSKMNAKELEGMIGWTLSFNVIQSKVAQWQ